MVGEVYTKAYWKHVSAIDWFEEGRAESCSDEDGPLVRETAAARFFSCE